MSEQLAYSIYWMVAKLSAGFLTGVAEGSLMARRSMGTREIAFARSDIDLGLILEEGEDGPGKLCRLYRRFDFLRRCNPVIGCLQIFRRSGFAKVARWDSVFAAIEQGSLCHLYGPATPDPGDIFCFPEHARRRFLLWWELFFSLACRRRKPREVEKIALELWNYYAISEQLIGRPYLRRDQMRVAVEHSAQASWLGLLRRPEKAREFSFLLAHLLHARHRQPLSRMSAPLVFEAILPPFCIPRLFVVLPRADWPLPPEAEDPRAFLVTPEVLDLYIHMRNSFCYDLVPRVLRDLGIEAPSPQALLADLKYYCEHHFLFLPGFGEPCPHPRARLDCLEYALAALKQGKTREPVPPPELSARAAWNGVSWHEYYRHHYEELSERSERLETEVLEL